MEKNVANIERWASLLGGGALAAWTLRERRISPLTGALALGAATLLFRGATGHCPAYGALGVSTADLPDDWKRPLSRVREGMESSGRRFRGKWPLPEPFATIDANNDDSSRLMKSSPAPSGCSTRCRT